MAPQQRVREVCDYHSSVEAPPGPRNGPAAESWCLPTTCPRSPRTGGRLAGAGGHRFSPPIELGDDLHRVEVHPGVCVKPGG